MYKVVCFDLDGTLLTPDKKIDEKEKNIIRELKNININIVLVSGRHIEEMLAFSKELMLQENDFLISCDGQYIYDYLGEKVWETNHLSKKDLFFLRRMGESNITFFTKDKDFCVVKKKSLKKTQGKKRFITWKNLIFLRINNIEKILLSNCHFIDKLRDRYTVHRYGDNFIEILNKNVNKYNAIKELNCRYYDVGWDCFLYFGDDVNDIECFENIPDCVAMSTAPDMIKNKAKYFTSSCAESGVYKALKEIFEL